MDFFFVIFDTAITWRLEMEVHNLARSLSSSPIGCESVRQASPVSGRLVNRAEADCQWTDAEKKQKLSAVTFCGHFSVILTLKAKNEGIKT